MIGARQSPGHFPAHTIALTGLTLLAFAANAVLCRLALGGGHIDASSFTAIRFVSGAVTLWVLSTATGRGSARGSGSWGSGIALAVYGICFSFAYMSLSTGTGALILFAAVQATMIMMGHRAGERPGAIQWGGLTAAMGGLAYLTFPGLTAPDPVGSVLMAAAGAGWGVYSVRGRGASDPVGTTTDNFIRSVPFVLAAGLVYLRDVSANAEGVTIALISGSVTSGLGYVVWYAALRGLTTVRAAVVQLAVPVIAAAAGVVLLSEELTTRLVIASIVILGGIFAVIAGKKERTARE